MTPALFSNSYVISIPQWHPVRLNKLLTHWARAHKHKKADREMVWAYAQKVPKAQCKRRVHLHLILKGRQKPGDPDSRWKSVLDALVHAGALKDDSHQWCELGQVTFGKPKMEWWGTIIRLEDIA